MSHHQKRFMVFCDLSLITMKGNTHICDAQGLKLCFLCQFKCSSLPNTPPCTLTFPPPVGKKKIQFIRPNAAEDKLSHKRNKQNVLQWIEIFYFMKVSIMIMQFSKHGTASRLSMHLWVICGSQMQNPRVITPWRQTTLCVVIVCSSIFQTKQTNSQLHLNDKVPFFLCHLLSSGPRAFSMPSFFGISVHRSVTSSQSTRKPALSSQAGRQWRNGRFLGT